MKIAIILSEFCSSHNPINFNYFLEDPKGQSGTNIIFFRLSEALAKLGHDISVFSLFSERPDELGGFKVYDLNQKNDIIKTDWDCIFSISEPDALRGLPIEPLRIVSMQLNGFSYMQSGFDDQVDLWLSPSRAHKERHMTAYGQNLDPNKWLVLPDGCREEDYIKDIKIPGRVIWISSCDRGAHWLLQEWSKIKAAVPHASLKIFYNFEYGDVELHERGKTQASPDIYEFANRIRYIKEMVPRLKHLDVEHVGGVSRNQIAKEMSQAECLAYSCDTTVWSEGFSISLLEGCLMMASPVATECDALKDVYGGVVPMIPLPVKDHISEFSDLVIKALTDDIYRNEVNERCHEFALKHTWDKIAKQLEGIILNHPKYKFKYSEKENLNNDVIFTLNDDASEDEKFLISRQIKEITESGIPANIYTNLNIPGVKTLPLSELEKNKLDNNLWKAKVKNYEVACLDFGNHPSYHGFWFDEVEIREKLWNINSGDYILDIGACYGSYSLDALSKGAKMVYAWSPQAHGYLTDKQVFEKSLLLNDWSNKCTVYDNGLYHRYGWLDCYKQVFFNKMPNDIKHANTNTISDLIKVDTLKNWYDSLPGNNKNDLKNNKVWIKLDVEGAELEVLLGGQQILQELNCNILLENHLQTSSDIDVKNNLEALGYKENFLIPYHSRSFSLFTK